MKIRSIFRGMKAGVRLALPVLVLLALIFSSVSVALKLPQPEPAQAEQAGWHWNPEVDKDGNLVDWLQRFEVGNRRVPAEPQNLEEILGCHILAPPRGYFEPGEQLLTHIIINDTYRWSGTDRVYVDWTIEDTSKHILDENTHTMAQPGPEDTYWHFTYDFWNPEIHAGWPSGYYLLTVTLHSDSHTYDGGKTVLWFPVGQAASASLDVDPQWAMPGDQVQMTLDGRVVPPSDDVNADILGINGFQPHWNGASNPLGGKESGLIPTLTGNWEIPLDHQGAGYLLLGEVWDRSSNKFAFDSAGLEVGMKGEFTPYITAPPVAESIGFDIYQQYTCNVSVAYNVTCLKDYQNFTMTVELVNLTYGLNSGSGDGEDVYDNWTVPNIHAGSGLLERVFPVTWGYDFPSETDGRPSTKDDLVGSGYEQNWLVRVKISAWLSGPEQMSDPVFVSEAGTWVTSQVLRPQIRSLRGSTFLEAIPISNQFFVTEGDGETSQYDNVTFSIVDSRNHQINEALNTCDSKDVYSVERGGDGQPYFTSSPKSMADYFTDACPHPRLKVTVCGDWGGGKVTCIGRYAIHYLQTPTWLQDAASRAGEYLYKEAPEGIPYYPGEGAPKGFNRGWELQFLPDSEFAGFGYPTDDGKPKMIKPFGDLPLIGGEYGLDAAIETTGVKATIVRYSGVDYTDPEDLNNIVTEGTGIASHAQVKLAIAGNYLIDVEFPTTAAGSKEGNANLKMGMTTPDYTGITIKNDSEELTQPQDSASLGPYMIRGDGKVTLFRWGATVEILGCTIGGEVGVDLGYHWAVGTDIDEDYNDDGDPETLMYLKGLDWGEVQANVGLTLSGYGYLGLVIGDVRMTAWGDATVYFHLPPPLFEGKFVKLSCGIDATVHFLGATVYSGTFVGPYEAWFGSPGHVEVTERSVGLTWMPRYWAIQPRVPLATPAPYPYSKPNVASGGNTSMKVWVDDDRSKPNYPASLEVYSAFSTDGVNWNPERITSDDLQQLDPAVVGFDKNGDAVAVWGALTQLGITMETDLDADLFNTAELQYAVWDNETQEWNEPIRLTNNAIYDGMPEISWTAIGDLIMVWLSTDTPFDPMNRTIMSSVWNGASWSEPQVVAEDVPLHGLPTVASYQGSRAAVVWPQDSDDNVTTSRDVNFFCADTPMYGGSWSTTRALTSGGDYEFRSPSLGSDPQTGELALTWVAMSTDPNGIDRHQNLMFSDLNTSDLSLGTTRTVASDRIFSEPQILLNSENQRVVVWNDGVQRTPVHAVGVPGGSPSDFEWTNPVRLIDPFSVSETPYHSYSSFALTDSGRIVLTDSVEALKGGVTNDARWSGGAIIQAVSTKPQPGLLDPWVMGVDPGSAAQGSTQVVAVTGLNLGGATGVDFGPGVNVLSCTADSATQITAEISVDLDADIGTRDISVSIHGHPVVLEDAFRVTEAPLEIKSVSPQYGGQGQNLDVRISGTKLTDATDVSFGDGVTVNGITARALDGITVNITVDDYASRGFRDVSVETPNGVACLEDGFLVKPAPPTVTSISPGRGVHAQSLDVVITGSRFRYGSVGDANWGRFGDVKGIDFGFGSGITVNSFHVDSPTQITANITIDMFAESGPRDVSVTTAGGTGTLESGFRVASRLRAPPILDPIGVMNVNEQRLLTFTAAADDPGVPMETLTFSLGDAPSGAHINATTGVFTWIPTDAQGPGVYRFVVAVSDGAFTDSETITVTVNEDNLAPVLDPIDPQAVDEETLLGFQASASDPDVPAQRLAFSLGGAPAGAGINEATGVFAWTPTEAQGPGVYNFDVVVSDGALTDSRQVTVTVREVNLPPALDPITPQSVDEEQQLTFQATASDPDLPKSTLTFSLAGAPHGAAIDSSTGVFTWTPSEAQGPHVYSFDVVASDGLLSSSRPVSVTVREVNLPPVLDPIPVDGQTMRWDDLVTFTAAAADPDLPENTLTFTLVGAPDGATIDQATGLATWTPGQDQIGTHAFTVRVTDGPPPDGISPLFDEETVTVTVDRRPTTLVYSGDYLEQYSDQVTLKATLTDTPTGAPVSGKLVTFEIGSQSASAYTDASGLAEATIILNQASGSYQVTASFEGDGWYYPSSTSHDFDINKEKVGTEYTGDTFIYTAGPSISTASVVLAATLTQEADGYPGNIQLARVRFELFKAGNLTTTPDMTVTNIPVDSGGKAFTTASLPVDVWTVYVKIDTGNGYWTASPVGMGVITVDYGSTTKRVAGGGWIADSQSANGKGNFGFTVNYQKTGTPKGNSVYLFRGIDGFNYLVKSNSWQGGGLSFFQDPSKASFSGKCVVQKIDPATGQIVQSWGNYRFIVDIVDGDVLNPRAADRYAITILDSSSAVWRQIGTRSSPIALGGGNVAIHSKG